MSAEIHIIGIGDSGPSSLDGGARELVENAEVLVGGNRHLEMFPGSRAERIPITGKLDPVFEALRQNRGKKRIVVLASGDPLFHGIAHTLMKRLPREWFRIHPNVSSMQMAFARAREPWEDAVLVSIHGKPLENLAEHLEAKKLGLFTDDKNTPDAIARWLLSRGENNWRGVVCENLGGADERVVESTLEELAAQRFAPLNVLLLLRAEAGPAGPSRVEWRGFGVPEDLFHQRKPKAGLITKTEVRVLCLSKLQLTQDSIVWDIGAGSGSVSIEAARLAPRGRVYAIEKNVEDLDIVRRNIARFALANVEAVHATAPEGLDKLEAPDAVFIGGTAGNMGDILRACAGRLRPGGRIVVTLATVENLAECLRALRELHLPAEVTQVSIARGKDVAGENAAQSQVLPSPGGATAANHEGGVGRGRGMTRFEALNPVCIVASWRP
ncbi:MAG: precorrin-6y C5,15-methyltransferase (decarboxylating) subunit CbiE [Euryarchaeota archaeon]|nr:precorrin-6y C5,15-methyltransferase (decarboxylating) subunit CbiE [Euryarchaeota archaeon]